MDPCAGEVGQATRVVQVEVGEDDVPDVVGRVAECCYLAHRGLSGLEPRTDDERGIGQPGELAPRGVTGSVAWSRPEQEPGLAQPLDVTQPKPTVHEHQASIG